MNKKAKNWISIILAVIVIGFIIIKGETDNYSLLKNHKLINGAYISGCKYGGYANGGKTLIYYYFEYKGKKYDETAMYSTKEFSVSDCEEYVVGRLAPVVYDPGDLGNNELLLIPKDFKKYEYNFPDSLNWIFKAYKGKD